MLDKADIGAGTYYDRLRPCSSTGPTTTCRDLDVLPDGPGPRTQHPSGRRTRGLCETAGVSVEDVLAETASQPDLYAGVLAGEAERDPYPATSRAASSLRHPRVPDPPRENLGGEKVKEMGNLYSAALPPGSPRASRTRSNRAWNSQASRWCPWSATAPAIPQRP